MSEKDASEPAAAAGKFTEEVVRGSLFISSTVPPHHKCWVFPAFLACGRLDCVTRVVGESGALSPGRVIGARGVRKLLEGVPWS